MYVKKEDTVFMFMERVAEFFGYQMKKVHIQMILRGKMISKDAYFPKLKYLVKDY